MNLVFFIFLIGCFIQLLIVNGLYYGSSTMNNYSESSDTNLQPSRLNCSKYKTDMDIIDSLPFYIDITVKDSNKNQTNKTVVYRTWAEYNVNTEQIENLTLFNEDREQSLNIFCFKHLHTLTLSYIDWPVPSDIQNLKLSLKKLLIIYHMHLSTLPPEIDQLQSLEYLVLLHTSIRHLPYHVKSLKKLTYLDVSYSNLVVLPTFIYQTYPALESLILEHNLLKRLPHNIQRLNHANLKTLDLSSNGELETLKGIEIFTNLTSLLVNYCQLKEIPKEIFQLKSLQVLSLQHNQLKSVSFASLANLTNLTAVYLSNNEIKNITGIGKLQSLTNLDLSNNSLEEIPLEILSLNLTLVELDLSNNNLTSLPDQLTNMANLKTLRLTGNQFSSQELKKIKSKKFTQDKSVVEIDETATTATPAGSEKTVLSTAHLPVHSDFSSLAPATNGSTPKP